MNKVILTGNLVRDPELRKTPNGTSVVKNVVAVQRDRKDENGEYPVDFINFVAWNNCAEYLANNGKKGNRIELSGRWQVSNWNNKNGEAVISNEVYIESITVLARKQKETISHNNNSKALDDDGDLPF